MGVRNSRVEVFARHVEKYTTDPPATAGKYAAVHEIAASHGFIAPRVLEVRSDRVLLERIHDQRSLREVYLSGDPQAAEAFRRAGEVLALLHAHLPTKHSTAWSPPSGFVDALRQYLARDVNIGDLPAAVLHGDYSFTNVFVLRGSASIVVMDPCANFGSTFNDWSLAPLYIDIGKMLACLEGQVGVRELHRSPSRCRIDELQRVFIGGYESVAPALDVEIAHGFAFAVAAAQFRRRFGLLSALHRASLYNWFRGNFPAARKMHERG